MPPLGFSGRLARFFIDSKLTPLLIIASLALGLYAVIATPKEEEPTIKSPAADVFIAYPGATSQEVDQRIARPTAALIREIPTVKHVVSAAEPDSALLSVEFRDGVDRETALTQLYDRLASNADQMPSDTQPPLIKTRGVEDVPVLTLTLWEGRDDAYALRRLAAEVAVSLEDIPQVSRATVIGGSSREIQVRLDPTRLGARGISPTQVVRAIQGANLRRPADSVRGATILRVEVGGFLKTPEDVAGLVVATGAAGPVYLRDVATVVDGAPERSNYVFQGGRDAGGQDRAAVTIVVTKVRGANAATVNAQVLKRMTSLRGPLIPSDVHVETTRDAGKTATERVSDLLLHMLLATGIVVVLVAVALGWREALIVAVVIPVTLALVPLVYNLTGFTLNRITLAAMIFAIGILVDDAIVIIENIHRRFESGGERSVQTALLAVNEVGNPTILATLTVIAALLPAAFVSGMVGQYLRPLPIGASIAMLYSLVVALTVTPYLAYRMLRGKRLARTYTLGGKPTWGALLGAWYQKGVGSFLDRPKRRWLLYAGVVLALTAAMGLVAVGGAHVKLLPNTDVDEMAVIIDLPAGASLETTAQAASDVTAYLRTVAEVKGYQTYVGVAGPATFQGLARHYTLRSGSHQAEIQIQLVPASERKRRSHDLALDVRPELQRALTPYGATFTVAEAPPGPPVQATLVAEVYGPDPAGRLDLARQVRRAFAQTAGVTDVDWSAKPGTPRVRIEVDPQKAALNGVTPQEVAQTVGTEVAGERAAEARLPDEREPVPVTVRLPLSDRGRVEDLASLSVTNAAGKSVPLTDVARLERDRTEAPIYRKDLLPVIFVTGETVGPRMAPLYAALDLNSPIRRLVTLDGVHPRIAWTGAPADTARYAVAWAGEWTTTYELFRDLGVAFLGALVFIYLLLVGWFRSFLVPLVIMTPIPLTLIGVLPAHALVGMFLSGTGMIGLIALAGILARNSILLIDFANARVEAGASLRDAVLEAGEVRARPILLTAATVILGDGVLLFDPLLEGLGLTLMSGALIATLLTLLLVPVLYHHLLSASARRTAWLQAIRANRRE